MGYRSHGHLVFPSVYRGLYEKMCPSTLLHQWDDDTDYIGYTVLTFYDWKWYESAPPVAEIQAFMEKIQELYDLYEFDRTDLAIAIGQLPFEDMVELAPWFLPKLASGAVGTINAMRLAEYSPQRWDWGFNMQGEEADDYTVRGHPEELGGYRSGNIANMWGYEYGGQAFHYEFKTAAARNHFTKNFNKIKAGTDIKMDVSIAGGRTNKRFVTTLHSPSRAHLWDQSSDRAGTDLSDPDKSFPMNPSQYIENDLAFAIWDEYEIIKSGGDIYEMDIWENASAEWDFSAERLELPDNYLKAVEKEYELE